MIFVKWLFACIAAYVCWTAAQAVAAPDKPSHTVLEFLSGEIAFADQNEIPGTGWEKRPTPALWLSDEARAKLDGKLTGWGRFRFDRAQVPDEPLAIYTENNRERLTVFLNGVELFRNYRSATSQTLGWNRPYIIPVPQKLLREAGNELVLRVGSDRQFSLGVGTVKVGSQEVLGRLYNYQQFWRVTGSAAANYAMLFLTFAAFLMWMARRSETEIFWLVMTGLLWFVRDFHFFAEESPLDPYWFQQVSYYSLYFAVAASLSFCVAFLKLPNYRRIIAILFAIGVALCIFRVAITSTNRTDLATSLATLVVSLVICGLMIFDWIRHRSLESAALIAIVVFTTALGLHDVGRIPNVNWWQGLGFHVQPYTGLLLFSVFLLSVGRKYLRALVEVETLNASLEQRVETATQALAASERARQKIEVEHAVGIERERLMREMHDGIGSNLVTALAVVRKQGEAPVAEETLQRAITDLKLTVDSLAPVEGDVVALLANLRHRMEPDMEKAGVKCVWRVVPCPSLDWLDAPNALHMLRIIQEGVGNVLSHAGATSITIACRPSERDGRSGVELVLADDGCGFDIRSETRQGRGLSNMRTRARQLSAELDVESSRGEGSRLKLWLPIRAAHVV
ncbi:ATP-binding protein [uncultured Sphingorhabdus sp.]|uniref:sensor histidine kinase n=1 Tax=uncultured Sphingorhabdus sp. TaxID=1686106 RepID=UPI00262615DF|nr:ATP-binding protein [uncultured Sphingorhabdus sp.]HMS20651.1 7TM diverse intracellular signaling domain-containing protein [Sphingorhabdus sp.]